jgi:hypothetical protein
MGRSEDSVEDQRFGLYKSSLYFAGTLTVLEGNLKYGSEFKRTDGSRVPVGAGNRAQILVQTNIIMNDGGGDPYPGLDDYGLVVGWDFNGQDGVSDDVFRQPNYTDEGVSAANPALPANILFMDGSNDLAPSGIDPELQFRRQDFQIYRLPEKRPFQAAGIGDPFGTPMIVIPDVVARADFLRVFLWTNPRTYTFTGGLFMNIWALVGANAQ